YTQQAEFDRAAASSEIMNEYGLDRDVKTVDEAVAIEPALASARSRIVGATYTESDESGDAHVFTQELAKLAQAKGAKFLFSRHVKGLVMEGDKVAGVRVSQGAVEEVMKANAYVVALGSYSPLLTRQIGLSLPVYPAKGYSASVPIKDDSKAPKVSLTD